MPSPGQLLVAAASLYQLLSSAVAPRSRVAVADYRDEAIGEMPAEPGIGLEA